MTPNRSIYKYNSNWGHQVGLYDGQLIPWVISYYLVDGKWEHTLIQTIPAAMKETKID